MIKISKALGEELLRHHEFAAKAQAAVAKSSPKAFESRIERFKLDQLRPADASEIVEYLKHQRQYKELMERYSSPEESLERIEATARRVGLTTSKIRE